MEFRRKWSERIDAIGPSCSCLVIVLALAFGFFMFLMR